MDIPSDNKLLEERIGINLPEHELDLIRFHPSVEGLTRGNRRALSARENLGAEVIRLVYIVYLYAVRRINDRAKIANLVMAFTSYAINGLYERYNLESFAIVGPAEKPGARHVEMASKLVAAVYKAHGFHNVYAMLRPLFRDAPTMLDTAYKTIVQEYAQAKRLVPSYSTRRTGGTDTTPIFNSVLRIGSQSASGSGRSKKAAEAAAAKEFAARYHVKQQISRPSKPQSRDKHIVNQKRTETLESAAIAIGLPVGCMSVRQFDICLTHESYAIENPMAVNNVCLKAIGATVLNILALDYLEEHCDPERFDFIYEKNALLREQCLANTVPSTTTDALLVGKTVSGKREPISNALRAEIVKSIIACIYMNYAASGKVLEGESLRTFATRIFDLSYASAKPNYRTIAQEIVQALRINYSESYEERRIGKSQVFRANIEIGCRQWTVRGSADGKSKQSACEGALAEILPKVLHRCPHNRTIDALRAKMQPVSFAELTPNPEAFNIANRPIGPAPLELVTPTSPIGKDSLSSARGDKVHEPSSKATDGKKIDAREVHARKPQTIQIAARQAQQTTTQPIRPVLPGWTEQEKTVIRRSYGDYGLFAKRWSTVLKGRSEYDILYAAITLGVIHPTNGESFPTPHDMELVDYFQTHSLADEVASKHRHLPDEEVARANSLCLYEKRTEFDWKGHHRDQSSRQGTSISRHSATERYKPPTRGDAVRLWSGWDSCIFEQ